MVSGEVPAFPAKATLVECEIATENKARERAILQLSEAEKLRVEELKALYPRLLTSGVELSENDRNLLQKVADLAELSDEEALQIQRLKGQLMGKSEEDFYFKLITRFRDETRSRKELSVDGETILLRSVHAPFPHTWCARGLEA